MPQKTTVRWVKKVGMDNDNKDTNSEVNFLQYIRCHHRNNCEMLLFHGFIICH